MKGTSMKTSDSSLKLLVLCLLTSAICYEGFAQGTAFTYQGRLNDNGVPASGTYDFRFRIATDADGNDYAGSAALTNGVPVAGGLFTVTLDFGAGIFTGSNYWLQIEVRTNGPGGYSTLSPLQAINATPYALTASNLSGTLPATQLTGTLSDARLSANVSLLGQTIESAEIADGSVTTPKLADDAVTSTQISDNSILPVDLNLSSFDDTFWKDGGNDFTSGMPHVLGTTDDQPIHIQVFGLGGLRLEPGTLYNVNVIAGAAANSIASGLAGATIGGGGRASSPGGPAIPNRVEANYSTVSGGEGNTVTSGAQHSTIGGGLRNNILENASYSTIGGGATNVIQTNSPAATIAGGQFNRIGISSLGATIGGGQANAIDWTGPYSTISGGKDNMVAAYSGWSTIAGGADNLIGSYTSSGTIAGGESNRIGSYEHYATIAGGLDNQAMAPQTFVAGSHTRAMHDGAFVWADSTAANFASDRANQFKVRAGGGVQFVAGSSGLNPPAVRVDASGSAAVGFYVFQTSSDAATVFENRGTGDQIKAFNGPGSQVYRVDNDGDVFAKSFNPSSDRHLKENFDSVKPGEILAKVAALPISRWNFKKDGITHIGPMAQDFYDSFGLGTDDKHIATVDADGVALAAIQGLNQKLEQKEVEITELKHNLAELKALVARITVASVRKTVNAER
jgi:trimeric autotransporter adhesin